MFKFKRFGGDPSWVFGGGGGGGPEPPCHGPALKLQILGFAIINTQTKGLQVCNVLSSTDFQGLSSDVLAVTCFIYKSFKFPHYKYYNYRYQPVGRAVTRSSLEQKVWGSISGRSNRTQCCHRLATAATFVQKLLCCAGAKTRRWAPPTYCEYKERFDLIITDQLLKFFYVLSPNGP